MGYSLKKAMNIIENLKIIENGIRKNDTENAYSDDKKREVKLSKEERRERERLLYSLSVVEDCAQEECGGVKCTVKNISELAPFNLSVNNGIYNFSFDLKKIDSSKYVPKKYMEQLYGDILSAFCINFNDNSFTCTDSVLLNFINELTKENIEKEKDTLSYDAVRYIKEYLKNPSFINKKRVVNELKRNELIKDAKMINKREYFERLYNNEIERRSVTRREYEKKIEEKIRLEEALTDIKIEVKKMMDTVKNYMYRIGCTERVGE